MCIYPCASGRYTAHLITGEQKYLKAGKRQIEVLELFNGIQPDYHLYETSIRHWDGYWFGKRKMFGDTFPHYWSALTGNIFDMAGAEVASINDILQKGIYITNAVKTPKTEYAIDKSSIENSLPYLEAELSLFPNIKVIMLMGDVAKKAFNMIVKKSTKKIVLPAVSTYKLRNSEIYYKDIRVMPSYIMTGGNILIEKSKVTMATEDIANMLQIIK